LSEVFEQIRESLESCGPPVCIIGVGNRLRADDAAGCLVIDKLAAAPLSAKLIDAGTAPENYIGPVRRLRPKSLLIIDAVDFGAAAGAVRLFGPGELDSTVFSTHSLSPRVFIDMVGAGRRCAAWLVGIQPGGTVLGGPVGEGISRAVNDLASLLSEVFSACRA
jgi:hydrogenase 3 maturation protease